MERNEDDLKKRIKDRLLSLGLTNSEIHKKTGIPKGTISGMVSDNPSISIDNLFKIATTFGISMDYLFGLSDLKSPETDFKVIHKATGLSDRAIENITTLHKRVNKKIGISTDLSELYEELSKGYKDGLDHLLSSNYLGSFLLTFENYMRFDHSEYISFEDVMNSKVNIDDYLNNYISDIKNQFTEEQIENLYLLRVYSILIKMKHEEI